MKTPLGFDPDFSWIIYIINLHPIIKKINNIKLFGKNTYDLLIK